MVSQRPGKDPVVVEDHELNSQYSKAVFVVKVSGVVEGDVIVVQHPNIPNG